MFDQQVIADFYAAVEKVAGFRLPRNVTDRFEEISAATTVSRPAPALARLRPVDDTKRDWLRLFRISATYDVRHGLAASAYHLWRVSTMESEIIRIGLDMMPRMNLPKYGGGGGGNTDALDFEYQAFAFSLRRTLEYLAVAVGAFFKCDAHSIRDLTRTIRAKQPLEYSEKMIPIVDAGLGKLRDILPLEATAPKSVRDRLAHWTAVGAGVINYRRGENGFEISVSGGGDNQLAWESASAVPVQREEIDGTGFLLVGPILEDQLNRVLQFVFQVLDELAPSANGA